MPIFFVHTPELIRIILGASSATARLLSLAVLLLSLAPLGSLYVVMFSLGWQGTNMDDSHLNNTLAHILKDPNATIEELWTAVFIEQRWNTAIVTNSANPSFVYLPIKAQSMHHLSVVLPWIFSIIFGVVVPAVLSLWSYARRHRTTTTTTRGKKHKAKLLRKLERYEKQLNEEDRQICLDSDSSDSEMTWKLPRPGCTVDDDQALRTVTGVCTICLQHFQIAEKVCWSLNFACRHTYHSECAVSWLMRRSNRYQLCPCCRQPFLKAT